MRYTNKHNIPLPIAVMLIHDEYDHDDTPNVLSVTTMLKSVRRIILETRGSPVEQEMDISELIASTQGTALHDALERAWLSPKLPEMLQQLGIPKRVAEKIRVNPTDGTRTPLDIFLEKRSSKKLGKWTISGKFDFIMEGKPMDLKNTSTFKWSGDHDDYIMQLSMYRWLNPDLTNKDLGEIMFWFKDFSNYSSGKSGYPPFSIAGKQLNLLTPAATESWVKKKLNQLEQYMDTPEKQLPLCTPKELWQSAPSFKYYSKPDAMKASKVFDSMHEANSHMLSKGKGHIVEVGAEPKACGYCPARMGCSQYSSMVQQGIVK